MALLPFFDWPYNLYPRDINIKPPRETRSLTQSLTNFEQVVPVIRAPFNITLKMPTLTNPDKLLTYRVLLASFEGRANLCRIPVFDFYAAGSPAAYTTFSDGTAFSDLTRFRTSDISGITVDAGRGERDITIDFDTYGQALRAGQYFGIDNNTYLARSVSWVGNVATINTAPSMRHNYVGGVVRLRPYLIVRLMSDDTGEHDLAYGQWAAPTLDLVEAFDESLS